MKKSIENVPAYSWGANCKGWHLVNTEQLSVIQEAMPPGTEEVRHQHQRAQQFFYLLKGEAVFELEGERLLVRQGEGLHILPGQTHQIKNESAEEIAFLVVSQPRAHGDRVLIG